MDAVGAPAPAVVHHNLVSDRRIVVEPAQELLGLPVVDRTLVRVLPDQVGLVGLYELVQLRNGLLRVVSRRI